MKMNISLKGYVHKGLMELFGIRRNIFQNDKHCLVYSTLWLSEWLNDIVNCMN